MPNIKRTYNELFTAQMELKGLGELTGAHFGVFVAENVERIGKRIQRLVDQFQTSEEYNEAVEAIKSKADGEMSEDELQARMAADYPEMHEENLKRIEELSEASKEETEINLLTIPVKHLPDELNGAQIQKFKFLVTMPD